MDRYINPPNFISNLPTSGASGLRINVTVRPANQSDIDFWMANIQPDINNENKADKGWNWHWIYFMGSNLPHDSKSEFYTLTVRNNQGIEIPCLLIWLFRRDHSPINNNQDFVYVSHFTTARTSSLNNLRVTTPPKMLGCAGFDIALTVAFEEKLSGGLWLHASPDGTKNAQQSLFDWYQNQLKLRPIPKRVGLHGYPVKLVRRAPLTRRNDGRYLYMPEEIAILASQMMDKFR